MQNPLSPFQAHPVARPRSRASFLAGVAASVLVTACIVPSAEVDDAELGEHAETGLAANSLRSPRLHGEFAFGGSNAAAFSTDRYHAWEFTLSGDAAVTLATGRAEGGPALDTVLALYRRGPRGAWGAAIARNDNDGATRFSRLEQALGPGRYRIVVRNRSIRDVGAFVVRGSCAGSGCPEAGGVPVPATTCHPSIADAIRACHDDRLSDPEFDPWTTSAVEAMRTCADPEVVARAWDALCLSPSSPQAVCGSDLEAFARGHLLLCRHELASEVLDRTCVFGTHYRQIFGPSVPLVVRGERVLRAGDTPSAMEAAQIVRAVRETAHQDVNTLADAFRVVDEGIVHQTHLWDASGRRAFVAYEVGAGDNSFGAFFPLDSDAPVARIQDGDIVDCSALWGEERRLCSASEPCAEGLVCEGQDERGTGRCLARRESADDIGASCARDRDCSESLVCAGASLGDEGLCNPAWMRGRFRTEAEVAIPDGQRAGVSIPLAVAGLATVSTDVRIDLFVVHPRISDLRITLTNPAGTEVRVFSGERAGRELVLRDVALSGFPGDESANGIWTLQVVDAVRGERGSVQRFGLEVTSRWD